ncbi:MAG: biotin--[acetyl-CoA-carboxylase] ligase [Candidatus Omnitrophota bacterium]
MQDKILDLLKRSQGYLSGEEISNRLKISRQTLWKYIQDLRDAGYDIVAVPHLGYQLVSCPDRLFPCEITHNLNTKFIGKRISYFDTVSSTMDIAVEMGMRGCVEGAIVIAEGQSRGRGRFNREWFSPKYKGIYLSLILRPRIAPNAAPILTLLAAVSICEAIKEVTGIDARIKWPNDILIHNKKLAGILTEISAETDITHFVVIGLGLNVNNDKKSLIAGATSLAEQKKEKISRTELLQEILRRIEGNYLELQENSAGAILDKWRKSNLTLGRRVRVVSNKNTREGQALDIDTDGALLIRNDSGLIEKVMAGDIVHCREHQCLK